MPPLLADSLHSCGLEADPMLLALARDLLPPPSDASTRRKDVSQLSPAELRTALLATDAFRGEEHLTVLWLADGVAVRMPRALVLERIDDWWYPAQDDVLISDGRHHVLIDHEETLTDW